MSTTTGDLSNSEDNAPAGSGSGSQKPSGERRERSGAGRPANRRAGGRSTNPSEKDLSKEELKAKLQRKRWGSRLRGLIWLFLIAMNLYLAYLIVSMVT